MSLTSRRRPPASRLQQLAPAHATVILDLSNLQFIDSTGLQILVTNFNEATHNGWQLRIDPTLISQMRRVVELVGLHHVLWPEPAAGYSTPPPASP